MRSSKIINTDNAMTVTGLLLGGLFLVSGISCGYYLYTIRVVQEQTAHNMQIRSFCLSTCLSLLLTRTPRTKIIEHHPAVHWLDDKFAVHSHFNSANHCPTQIIYSAVKVAGVVVTNSWKWLKGKDRAKMFNGRNLRCFLGGLWRV